MKYISTRGEGVSITSSEAIIKGLAGDGGLFVPEEITQVDINFIESLLNLDYYDRAVKVLKLFLTDYTDEELAGCVKRAYGNGKFDSPDIAPIVNLAHPTMLELWHGPTSAFKDMALQLLPQLLSTALKKTGETKEVVILVATSGDTGKAALEGFKDVDQTKIIVFYPNDGVSRIQKLQMVTQQGGNVNVTAVKGNFDDAQNGVKAIFNDREFADKMFENGIILSSANSINWGRLVPQIVYYFSAYADLVASGRIAMGDRVSFVVPTGNFGDIMAAFYAKSMGLPVNKLICASNSNNVLTDFFDSGVYDCNREFFKTISPSMDILVSSNLERLLYHITGDSAKVAGWMQDLAKSGRYEVDKETIGKIKETFVADWADEDATKEMIAHGFKCQKYISDPHTAVAWSAARKALHSADAASLGAVVIVSTASPYKFNESVLEALGESIDGMDEFELLDRLATINSRAGIPSGLAALKSAEVLHSDVVEKNDMAVAVEKFAVDK